MSVSINGTSGLVFNDASTQNTAATGFGFKNRILNGSMVLDQRNAGASVTPISSNYTLDRWALTISQSSKLSIQQAAASGAPSQTALKATSLSAYSIGAGDYFVLQQSIEGNNVQDLMWGTASAATVTLSFWVYSSLTGTFGGAIRNSGNTRSYPFTYTISVANTWEQKSITIAGDTSGTWLTTNGIGINVVFGLGVGSTYSGTAGAWAGTNYNSATGATSVVGTNGATFYITGVQLEKGSTATNYDVRSYGTELQLCQRYYQKLVDPPMRGVATGGTSGGASRLALFLPVPMRATPTVSTTGTFTFWNGTSATTGSVMSGYWVGGNSNVTGIDIDISIASSYSVGQAVCAYLSGDTTRWVALNSEL